MNRAVTEEEREAADAFHAPLPSQGNGNAPATQPASIWDIIDRASRDPQVDVNKIERLMDMAERVHAREAKAAYYTALSEMQTELPVIAERGAIKIGSGDPQKYALWEDINKAIKPILKQYGFALSFRTGLEETKITVTGVLSHAQGHAEETTIHLPADNSGSKNAVQAVGSSTSYGKRYTAAALLNLTSTGEDDDAKKAINETAPIDDDKQQKIRDLIDSTKADVENFCKYMKVKSINEIPNREFERAITALNLKAKAVHRERT